MGGDHLWDAVAAVGQMVSALALIVVIVQVRHARDEVQRSISHYRLDALRDHYINRANNESLNGIAIKAGTALGAELGPFQTALMERAGLTREESSALNLDLYALWICYAEAIPYADHLRDGERTAFDGALRNNYANPPGSLWYSTSKSRLDADAVRYVDNLLAQPG